MSSPFGNCPRKKPMNEDARVDRCVPLNQTRADYLIVIVTVTLPPSALLVSEMMFLAWL